MSTGCLEVLNLATNPIGNQVCFASLIGMASASVSPRDGLRGSRSSRQGALQGAIALAEALTSTTSLRMLDLGGCSIGVDGFLAVMASLAHGNTTLECLGFEDCRIASPPQDLTMRSLADMCKSNTTLRQLYLGKQQLSDAAFEARPLLHCSLPATNLVAD